MSWSGWGFSGCRQTGGPCRQPCWQWAGSAVAQRTIKETTVCHRSVLLSVRAGVSRCTDSRLQPAPSHSHPVPVGWGGFALAGGCWRAGITKGPKAPAAPLPPSRSPGGLGSRWRQRGLLPDGPGRGDGSQPGCLQTCPRLPAAVPWPEGCTALVREKHFLIETSDFDSGLTRCDGKDTGTYCPEDRVSPSCQGDPPVGLRLGEHPRL